MSSSTSQAQEQQPKPPQSQNAVASTSAPPVDDVDDLDDLDDVLDEFNKPSTSAVAPASSHSATTSSAPVTTTNNATASNTQGQISNTVADSNDDDGLDDILSQDFAKELAQGMEALMKELGSQSQANGEGLMGKDAGEGAQQFSEQDLMKQFEAMMSQFGQAQAGSAAAAAPASGSSAGKQREATSTTTSGGAAAPPTSTSAAGGSKPGNFNDAIAATLAKLKESDASATATNTSASDNPFAALAGADGEGMAKLLAALGGSGGEGGMDGGLDNPELAKMLEGMMDELMSRDILYEPLKELRDKYPAYLSGSDSQGISPDDRKRYEDQSRYIAQIVDIFEDKNYDPKNKQMTGKIQDLMNAMQDCGSPPKEIVGDMPAELENIPGFGGGAGSGAGNEDCTIM